MWSAYWRLYNTKEFGQLIKLSEIILYGKAFRILDLEEFVDLISALDRFHMKLKKDKP